MPRPSLPNSDEVAGIAKALRAEGYHRLQIGEAAASFTDQNGDRVEYTRASANRLAAYYSDTQRPACRAIPACRAALLDFERFDLMKYYIQPGDDFPLTASADVLSGAGVLVGSLFYVADGDALSGASVVISTTGVFKLPKVTADALTFGESVYWDDTSKKVTETTTSNTRICVAIAAAGAGVTNARVRLNGSF